MGTTMEELMTLATITPNTGCGSDAGEASDELACSIRDSGKYLRFSTLALRSCYTVNASSIPAFVELRDRTTNSASVYREKVLPIAKESLQSIMEFALYFKDLSCDECMDVIEEIIIDAKRNQELCMLNKDTHLVLASEFKKLKDNSDRVYQTCSLEKAKYDEQAKLFREQGTKKEIACKIAIGVCCIHPIAWPLALAGAGLYVKVGPGQHDRVQAIAAEEEAKLAVNAAMILEKTLQPALDKYCEAMDKCANEFQSLYYELRHFEGQGSKLKLTGKDVFHRMMRARSEKICAAVEDFMQFAISAESDLACLPDPPAHNYVEEWLLSNGANDGQSFAERIRAIGGRLLSLA